MIKILEDGEFPTCETCIYSIVKDSVTCIRKAPGSEILLSDNVRRAFWPNVPSGSVCGEGAWLVPVFSNSMSYSDIIIKLKREAVV